MKTMFNKYGKINFANLVFIVILIFFFISFLLVIFTGDNKVVKKADGFTISSYNVVLDVNEDNTIDVTENITVNFTEHFKHGIYKTTPEWLEYTGKDGKTIKRKSLITEYLAVGEEYTVKTENKKKIIKIGNPNKTVGIGEKSYQLKYTYNMGKDPFKGFDELIFHAFGDYWGTEINNASIQVNMPKNITGSKINFFTDKYRKENVNDYVNYYVSGNTLFAKFNKQYNLTNSLTIDIELPEGYFVGGSWNYGLWSLTLCIIIFVITLLIFTWWKKHGKNFSKDVATVEFYPPENYSSAEIGYIYGKRINKKLTISLLIQLASKGYIKIDEIESEKKEIQITNLIKKPTEQLTYNDLVSERVFKVKKLKAIDPDILNKNEMTMMNYLFKKGDEKILKTNIEKFLKVKDSLVQKGFIEILLDNEDTRFDELKKRKDEYESSKKQYDLEMAEYEKKMSKMPKINDIELVVYNRLFENEDVIILSEHKTFYKAFNDVEILLKTKLKDLVEDKNASEKMIWSAVLTFITIVLYLISFSLIEDMDPSWNIVYKLSFICIFINLFFTFIMGRKTKYGEKIRARVKGFRDFLETAEKEKLEALVLENPYYFYNILPYTYVLNISKKWIEKFENIPIPEMDMGAYNFNDSASYKSLYHDIYIPESAGSSSNSSGCSSCGGGCSSCGGGGSW